MAKRIGQYTIKCETMPSIISSAAVVGKKEGEGPLGSCFDMVFEDGTLNEKTWEKSESRLQTEAVTRALNKASLSASQMDYIFAGDLLAQCIGSTFGLRSLGIPFLGQYGACSTMAQTLAMAALFVEAGFARHAVAVTSSHFCSAERQFRFPLEYGALRPPTAQWTATASGAAIVGSGGEAPYVSEITVGKIVDLGIKDANNMGAAMAPAASETISAYFQDMGNGPEDFDMILTGDLGQVGSALLMDLLEKDQINIRKIHQDCGLLLYDRQTQNVNAGGSGCGCSAAVLCSYILKKLRQGELKNVLFVATGAMMSTTSSQQGESIPGIAHLLHLKSALAK